jgi:REP element-mobilizing transposase RayT
MSQGYQIYNPAATYFLTLQVVDWVDVFTREVYRKEILDSLTYCRKSKGLVLYAYVLMTNHLHILARAENENLPDILRDFKKFTASQILRLIQAGPESRQDWMLKRFEFAARSHVQSAEFQFWTHENHAIEIQSPYFTKQKVDYIHKNPVRAGWVAEPWEWLYSSASNYCGKPSLIEIDFIN